MRNANSGFTMMEITIVLAIIGLVMGGIMSGMNMMKSSRLRGIITQTTSYTNAMEQFKDQYGEMPGDFTQAQRIWGKADTSNANVDVSCIAATADYSATYSGRATCNGNGNGQILQNEAFRAWQHMANAGLIEGNYSGKNGTGGVYHAMPGYNTPAGPLKNSVFHYFLYTHLVDDAVFFDGDYTYSLILGLKHPSSNPVVSLLTPKQLYDIDLKTDDGKPAYGYVRTIRGTFVNTTGGRSCVTKDGVVMATAADYGLDPLTAEYTRGDARVLCYPIFMYGFGLDNRGLNR